MCISQALNNRATTRIMNVSLSPEAEAEESTMGRKLPRRRCQVQFHTKVKVATVPYWVSHDVDDDESENDNNEHMVRHCDVWYTSQDFSEMARRDDDLIKSASSDALGGAGGKHHRRRPTRSNSESMLGLETKKIRAHRRKRMDAGRDAVLIEQERQWEMDVVNPERISHIYQKKSSVEAREQAYHRAVKLASALALEENRSMLVQVRRTTSECTGRLEGMRNHPFVLGGNNKPCPIQLAPLSPEGRNSRWVASTCVGGGPLNKSLGVHRDSLLLVNNLRVPVRR